MADLSQEEVEARIQGLDDETANNVVCALIGHSKIQSHCFGYWYCGRCNDQVGDSLGGVYNSEHVVLIGHNCAICQKNFNKLSWKDTYRAPDPFKAEDAA